MQSVCASIPSFRPALSTPAIRSDGGRQRRRAAQGGFQRPAVPAASGEVSRGCQGALCSRPDHADRRSRRLSALQLVLINISDHHTRTRVTQGVEDVRVMGCLLGSQAGRTVDISNSFEMRFVAGSASEIDHAFLVKKMEQCECQERAQ